MHCLWLTLKVSCCNLKKLCVSPNCENHFWIILFIWFDLGFMVILHLFYIYLCGWYKDTSVDLFIYFMVYHGIFIGYIHLCGWFDEVFVRLICILCGFVVKILLLVHSVVDMVISFLVFSITSLWFRCWISLFISKLDNYFPSFLETLDIVVLSWSLRFDSVWSISIFRRRNLCIFWLVLKWIMVMWIWFRVFMDYEFNIFNIL